ncbi:MAG: hypothetical protein Q9174_003470 [Haloplaca sp. 1 TL-2023]
MATTSPYPMPDPPHELFSSPRPRFAEKMGPEPDHKGAEQERSSSLSDIGDRPEENLGGLEQTVSDDESDPNDTEAETERLEDSPQKWRQDQNLMTTAANSSHDVGAQTLSRPEPDPVSAAVEAAQPSEVGSLSDSSVEVEDRTSTSISPRKRKRSYIPTRGPANLGPRRKRKASHGEAQPDYAGSTQASRNVPREQWAVSREVSDEEPPRSDQDTHDKQTLVKGRGKKNKRQARNADVDGAVTQSPSVLDTNGPAAPVKSVEAADSNQDDVEMEEAGEYTSVDNGVRDEEISKYMSTLDQYVMLINLDQKKHSAMESLSSIEKCFASLRDKLFDERLAKFETELAMLAEPDATHPELLGMKEVLEQRRDEKIQYENTLLKYKLGALQNKSKAEKAQVHGQYMQSVREIRDRNLEQANKEWYQIHKERRDREDDVPEYIYQFPTRRSEQISHQTAYNKEISLLSGIAKHRGFPAAPEIRGAKASEIDDDLEKMGIIQQPSAAQNSQPPALRASLTANAVLQRPEAVADELFLEQNPWANPQHPAHLHRQASALSRTNTPSAAPAFNKRNTEALGRRPASTLGERQADSILSTGSMASASQPEQDLQATRQGFNARRERMPSSDTPNRPRATLRESLTMPMDNQQSRSARKQLTPSTVPSKAKVQTTDRDQVQGIHMKPYVPRGSLKDASNSHSTPKLPLSSSNHYPAIKAEGIARLPEPSPTSQQYHRPVSLHNAGPGPSD